MTLVLFILCIGRKGNYDTGFVYFVRREEGKL